MNNKLLDVCNYIIYLSSQRYIDEDTREGVSPLKLQKLIYFSQCANLALTDKVLFDEDIQAWQYGPVVESVYQHYKSEGNKNLIELEDMTKALSSNDKKVIQGISDLLGKFSASKLVSITHQHDPWKNNFSKGENKIIPVSEMHAYYKNAFTFKD